MKSLIAFLRIVVQEMGDWCHISTDMDLKTIHARIESEGLSFMTITLPAFGKDFLRGLEKGSIDRSLFHGFRRGKGELPRFLGGFLGQVFDAESGVLLDSPSLDAIRAVHQLTSMFGKIALRCSPARERAAVLGFIKCEDAVRQHDLLRTPEMESNFKRIAMLLFRDVFTEMDDLSFYGELVPKHGPGSTADGLRANAKYMQKEWTLRLEKWFPARDHLIPNWNHLSVLDKLTVHEPEDERPVKVTLVPKTLKAPRIIAIEPTCMQYMQQSILVPLVEKLEADSTVSRFIGFTDQIPNQDLAREGSRNGELATLDLSEASDRVSNEHVRLLLDRFPSFGGAVDSCRSRKARVLDEGIIPLAKFASMGSALCFPFEAMVFLTIIFMSVEQELRTPLTRDLIKRYRGSVRVYGDDIIVPVDMVDRVSENLEAFGLKVNLNKSFWTGKFRESCGGDFYDGYRVTPIKVRRLFPTERTHAAEIISMSSLRNQLFEAGYESSVEWLDKYLLRLLGRYPYVSPDSPAIGRHDYHRLTVDGYHATLHKPMVKAYVVSAKLPSSKLNDHGALMKFFLKTGDLPVLDPEHLLRAGRPVALDIKLRKVPVL